ncbi:hypothetical protein [Nannocystis pusilla]|uniref:hypothetical protein n=1 Tax=Nannocystis pusilla TaxID=889268 RepID=UPI003DA2F279
MKATLLAASRTSVRLIRVPPTGRLCRSMTRLAATSTSPSAAVVRVTVPSETRIFWYSTVQPSRILSDPAAALHAEHAVARGGDDVAHRAEAVADAAVGGVHHLPAGRDAAAVVTAAVQQRSAAKT